MTTCPTEAAPPVLDVLDMLRHLVDVVTAAGPAHVDPAADTLTEPIYRQFTDPDAGRTYYHRTTTGPACLVARVLAAAGVPDEELTRLDTLPRSAIDTADLRGLTLTPGARRLLTVAQREQDDASTWGEVLELTLAAAGDEGLLNAYPTEQIDALGDAAAAVTEPTPDQPQTTLEDDDGDSDDDGEVAGPS